jgi:signal transduction histidine kinase
MSTREERAKLRELEDGLILLYPDLQQPSRYARIILEMGYENIDPALIPYLEMKEKKEIFNFTLSLVRMNKSVGTIEIGVDKAARVVKALNNFSHGNLEQQMVEFALRDSIESVITILWNKIKTGATVKVEVAPEVYLFGNQEELAQVWTNLMNNALQASNNKCNIRIRHWLVGNWHHIRFTNDGPPIPADVLPRIFDAFFTTKKQGEGTGLGLNISKQIIEKHGGQIKVESNGNETAFEILLPLSSCAL